MKTRLKLKKEKQKKRDIKKSELFKNNKRYHMYMSDHTYLKSKTSDHDIYKLTDKCVLYPTKPTKKAIEFYNKYGVPVEDTWEFDKILIQHIVEGVNATVEAGGDIIDWDYHKFDIVVVPEENVFENRKDVPLRECIEIMTDYLMQYLEADYTYQSSFLIYHRLQAGFDILGSILPEIWW